MKKVLLSLSFLFAVYTTYAQVTILDFESASSSTTFSYFGSTLEGTTTTVIENPVPGGINTSAMVSDFGKPVGAEVWAGAWGSLDAVLPIDVTMNTQVCIKVYSSAPGNLALKLEASSTGGDDWIKVLDIPSADQWIELCYDVQQPSDEAPNTAAYGNVYGVLTLFFDFGSTPTEDMTYYFDDVIVGGGGGATDGDITFRVDMNNYQGSYNTVFVSGEFNNWDAAANPMQDDDMDGIWETTIADIPIGVYEFKYQLDGWADSDQFGFFETCTQTDPTGMFVNRKLNVFGDETLDAVCFSSCYACGEGARVTIEVGTNHITVDQNGLFLAGGGNFGAPGDFPLADDDLDGIWTISFERQIGFESFYTFTNGACPDFSCKENIAGQPCSDPNNFDDRYLPPLTEDVTISTCYGECTDVATDCGGVTLDQGNITFRVDMNAFSETFTTVYVSGSFNGWDGQANALEDVGNGIWETTILLNGGLHQYKFQVDNWAFDEQFSEEGPCNVLDGGFINRGIEVDGDAELCFVWNTCDECVVGTNNVEIDNTIFELMPNLARDFTMVTLSNPLATSATVEVYDIVGNLKMQLQMDAHASQLEIPISELASGIHLVKLSVENKIATQKLVKQ